MSTINAIGGSKLLQMRTQNIINLMIKVYKKCGYYIYVYKI